MQFVFRNNKITIKFFRKNYIQATSVQYSHMFIVTFLKVCVVIFDNLYIRFGRMVTFQKKSDAVSLCLVFDSNKMDEFQKVAGYHHPQKHIEPPRGIDSYPPIFLYPSVSIKIYSVHVQNYLIRV